MYKEKFKNELIDIFEKPKNRFRESYIKKNHNSLYTEYISYVNNHIFLKDFLFIEKFYYFLNNITSLISCKTCLINKTKMKDSFDEGFRDFCSPKCAQNNKTTQDKYKATCIEIFGVDNAAKSPEVKAKIEETNIEIYGHKSSFQNSEVREKFRKNYLEKTGFEHPFQNPEVKKEIVKTNNERYGHDYFVQSEEYIIKAIEANNEAFGTNWYTQTDEYKKRVEYINLDRYGQVNHMQSPYFIEKTKKTLNEEYNVDYNRQRPDVIEKIKNIQELKLKSRYLKYNLEFLFKEKLELHFNHITCNNNFSINKHTLRKRLTDKREICLKCNPLHINESYGEIELYEWVKSLNINVILKDRDILEGKEIDVLIPEFNIGIEYNGIHMHSEKFKTKTYHRGWFCIQII